MSSPAVFPLSPALGARVGVGRASASASRTPKRAASILKAFDGSLPNAESPATAVPATTTTTVGFAVRARLEFGCSLAVVGSDAALGAWIPDDAARLTWSEGDIWIGAVIVQSVSTTEEFKLIVVTPEPGVYEWEECANRVLPVNGKQLAVTGVLGGRVDVVDEHGSVRVAAAPAARAPPPSPSFAHIEVPQSFNNDPPPEAATTMNSPEAWRGAQPEWIRHRDQSMEQFQMDVVKNRVPEDYVASNPQLAAAAAAIITGSRDAPSYLKKLELIQQLVGQGKCLVPPQNTFSVRRVLCLTFHPSRSQARPLLLKN